MSEDTKDVERETPKKAATEYTISTTLAVLGFLATIGIAIYTIITRNNAVGNALLGGELSAIQLVQLYTQSAFWLLVVVAIVLAGYAYDHGR